MKMYDDMNIIFAFIYKNYYFSYRNVIGWNIKRQLKMKPIAILKNRIHTKWLEIEQQKLYCSHLDYNKELNELAFQELTYNTFEQIKEKLERICP